MKSAMMLLIAAGAIVGGCATSYENRVASRLYAAGLPRPIADCMAGRMVDRLSVGQLQRISSFGKTLDRDMRDMTIGQITRRFAAIGDPEIVEVVTRAGLGCAIAGA